MNRMVVESSGLVLDTRNAVGANAGRHLFRLGAPKALGSRAQAPGLAAAPDVMPETALSPGA
jgi:hypothetical protein